MHSVSVLAQYLRVNGLKREWWIDLPELTSIRFGTHAFWFNGLISTELIMRSGDDEMKWWIDLPKLTTLTTIIPEGWISFTFCNPRHITLEGISYHSTLTIRHTLSHHCHSWQDICFQIQENRSHQEFPFLLSLIPRHHSRSARVSQIPSFFHTLQLWPKLFIRFETPANLWPLDFIILVYCICKVVHGRPLNISMAPFHQWWRNTAMKRNN